MIVGLNSTNLHGSSSMIHPNLSISNIPHVIQAVISQMKLIQIGTTNSKMLFPVKVLQHITVIVYTFVVSLIKCI